jgi:hypothetical protein
LGKNDYLPFEITKNYIFIIMSEIKVKIEKNLEELKIIANDILSNYTSVVDVKIQQGCYPDDNLEDWTRVIVVIDTHIKDSLIDIISILNKFDRIYIRRMNEEDPYHTGKEVKVFRLTKIYTLLYKKYDKKGGHYSVHIFKHFDSIQKKFNFYDCDAKVKGLPMLNRHAIREFIVDGKITDNIGSSKDNCELGLCVLGAYDSKDAEIYYIAPISSDDSKARQENEKLTIATRKYYAQKVGIYPEYSNRVTLIEEMKKMGITLFYYIQKIED